MQAGAGGGAGGGLVPATLSPGVFSPPAGGQRYNLSLGMSVHTDMVLPPLLAFGTEEQKQRYLVPAINGDDSSGHHSLSETFSVTLTSPTTLGEYCYTFGDTALAGDGDIFAIAVPHGTTVTTPTG